MRTTKTRRPLTNAQIDAAFRRRERRLTREPLATSVRYVPTRDSVVVQMNNEASLIIPRRLLQGLGDASVSELRNACVSGRGTSVSWPALDADFTIVSLLHGVYGGKKWMSELARHAGKATSEAKAKAARINGAKGGRPRNSAGRTRARR
jgi:Protein of unknown function (DUF2442)